ncbi:hypothetical protein M2399_005804 [Pseudomonas sp. BIGb0450]|uniref:M91 family zinc metallopeptidase n=1 Tax=unclassified Pseudomonas TaxID=196821 RepID=UPI002166D8E8|nr:MULTISPECIES: M91 family zinc metallopeptidase [unclassified Pseudomonas]MCS3420311.1 hypothetical protein [Pseudomonas sp. BIGb0558]MCS3440342.1 hypothetical protein [Pseudomonas sp. BIGb0450]
MAQLKTHPPDLKATPLNSIDFRHPPAYDPPVRLPQHVQEPIQIKTSTLINDGNLHASRVVTWDLGHPDQAEILNDTLLIETGNHPDIVHISKHHSGQLRVSVNGRSYWLKPSDTQDGPPPLLHIKTQGGNDRVRIDSDVRLAVKVEAGDGHDHVQAGGGATWLFGGAGNDTLRLADGTGYAEGNDGDDLITGGTGSHVMYGNNGNDRLYAGAGTCGKQSYLGGGQGNDHLYAGNGHTVIHGGRGDDVLVGHDRTTFYTGQGNDRVFSNGGENLIYGKAGDTVYGARRSIVSQVTPSTAGAQGLAVEGSDAFRQRVADDLELLRNSPSGQAMLMAMDAAARKNGGPVTIKEELHIDDSQYVFDSEELRAWLQHSPVDTDDPIEGAIKNGVPGSSATQAYIRFNRTSLHITPGNVAPPLTTLYHELAHAYNGANGTFLPGFMLEGHPGESPGYVANNERQAVGLETDAPPFDFDNDPATPATSTNPKPFTENTLHEEMGRPLRRRYS